MLKLLNGENEEVQNYCFIQIENISGVNICFKLGMLTGDIL